MVQTKLLHTEWNVQVSDTTGDAMKCPGGRKIITIFRDLSKDGYSVIANNYLSPEPLLSVSITWSRLKLPAF
jgi:hypothetical protein